MEKDPYCKDQTQAIPGSLTEISFWLSIKYCTNPCQHQDLQYITSTLLLALVRMRRRTSYSRGQFALVAAQWGPQRAMLVAAPARWSTGTGQHIALEPGCRGRECACAPRRLRAKGYSPDSRAMHYTLALHLPRERRALQQSDF